jgi:hypothetical protein
LRLALVEIYLHVYISILSPTYALKLSPRSRSSVKKERYVKAK